MDQGNRIDSRARGNANQLLEKYKKLAHDAQMNDDRVSTEYYLQFADHYFRVLADNKARQEEHRRSRDDYRGDRDSDDDTDGDETEVEAEAVEAEPKRPRGRRNPRRNDNGANDGGEDGASTLDPASLPPSIGATDEEAPAKPKRRAPRRKKDDGEAPVQAAVNG